MAATNFDPPFGRSTSTTRSTLIMSRRNKSNSNVTFSRAFKITVLFCTVVILLTQLSSGVFFKILNPVARPFWSVRESIVNSIYKNIAVFKSKDALNEENNNLRQKLLEANIRTVDYDQIFSENMILRGEFSTTTENTILGKIIARPYESPFDILIVDTGSNTTRPGLKVFGHNNILIGEIIEVAGRISKIQLYSNPSVVTETQISRTGSPLTLVGRGSGNFSSTVSREFDITVGDIVIIPSYRSYVVARVGSIEETEADSFKTVILSSPLNIFELSWILILQQ